MLIVECRNCSAAGTKILLTLAVGLMLVTGCAQPFHVRATDYQIIADINPETHALKAHANITLVPIDGRPLPEGPVWIALDLNKNLKPSDIRVTGADLQRTSKVRPLYTPDDKDHSKRKIAYASHKLYLENATDEIRVSIDYEGELEQDVASGEKVGEIHNFGVSAHIGPEGIYLSPSGHWCPTPSIDDLDQLDPKYLLADWTLQTSVPEDTALIASARREGEHDGRTNWKSPHRLTGMTLTGGKHDVWSRHEGGVQISVHMQWAEDKDEREANEKIAQTYLDQAARYIADYEPLLGPFPYDQYTIVENFFSSGFAFPMMTLFGPVVMHMGDNSFRHGYLDHELVHSWWGCGVDVDPRDGNWCESLTSYCTNYYGFVINNDEFGARKKRRNESNFLSRVKPKYDKPLGTYGKPGGCGRGIAYSKGSAVFHMLSREIGQEAFWTACRDITKRLVGRHASWDDLKGAFEEASGRNLDTFFAQWIRGSGAPALRLLDARYDRSKGELYVSIEQGDTDFDFDLNLRLEYGAGHRDIVVPVTESKETLIIPLSDSPDFVQLDPDYHTFRKLQRSEIMPTTATTKVAKSLTIVMPPGELLEAYETVAAAFEKPVKAKDDGSVVRTVADNALTAETLAGRSVLVLGEAVRHPAVQELLERTESPVRWTEAGFAVDDDAFDEPNHAVMMTLHHPDSPDDGLTVYAGNSDEALVNAAILGFYANSLLVFECGERCEVVVRRDFESNQRVEVSVE